MADFPRRRRKILRGIKRKNEDNLFKSEKQPATKKTRRKKVINNLSNEDQWQSSLKGTLTYNTLQEGMIILSRVKHVSSVSVQVEFPGLIFGTVPINEISGDFTRNILQQLKTNNKECHNVLKSIIKIGQLMPAKILSVTKVDTGHEVQATISPENINVNKRHNSFKKGVVVWANVATELDHGYELSLGINNCRVFLPFKNVDVLTKYDIGEPLYCVVHKVESSDHATTLTVNAKQEHIDKVQTNDLTLDDVIPGMKVQFTIEEISSKGIKGHFFDNCFGYMDEIHMCTANPGLLKEGKVIQAYVLFVEPVTKVTYLTLNKLRDLPDPQLERGKITSATVSSVLPRGLLLQLGKDCVGFITNKRLLNTLPKEAQLNIVDAVRKKYPVDSRHDCRILDYNYMQQLYICTFEKQLIKEKVFTVKDLSAGQITKVRVDKIVPNGLVVKAGQVQGFIPNIHLSNVQYSKNIKAKFSVGMNVNARVLNVTSEENAIFTLKEGLIDAKRCLMKTENAGRYSQYTGFVVQTKSSGALVAFFGDAKGWISKKDLNADNSGQLADPRDYFFIGQVVEVWILDVKNNILQVSLTAPKKQEKKKINLKSPVHAPEVDEKPKPIIINPVEHVQLCTEKNGIICKHKIGDRVDCKIQTVDEDKRIHISLCDGANSVVPAHLKPLSRKIINHNKINDSILPGIDSFYITRDETCDNESCSDEDDDDIEEKEKNRKKKKLSSAEKIEKAKETERSIIEIETQLADATAIPQTAEQFDRLLLANPNSSQLWLQYIAMHVAATELEKARSVGRKAIETIDITLVKEKFNIWIALLNIENMYGTKESFETVFNEAAKYNNVDIYLIVIRMFATSGKLMEMEEKIRKLRNKEKQNTKVWLELGRVYYSLKKFKEARNIKEAAIKSILDKKRQFDIIVRFGIMELQLGDLHQGIANFETILDTYPTKVTIWSTYVDQLVKQHKIDLARKVLERALGQRLSMRTMKSLFQKCIAFEENYGTPETIKNVQRTAKAYVTSLGVK